MSQRDARSFRQAMAVYKELRDNVTGALGEFFTIMRGLEARLIACEASLGINPGEAKAPPAGPPRLLRRLFGRSEPRPVPPPIPAKREAKTDPAAVPVLPGQLPMSINGEPIPAVPADTAAKLATMAAVTGGDDDPTAPGLG